MQIRHHRVDISRAAGKDKSQQRMLIGHGSRQGLGLASGLGSQQNAISVGKLLVQVASGVAGPGNAGHFQHTAAAQLVQHQAGVKGGGHLGCVGLHTPHKVQGSPAVRSRLSHVTTQAVSSSHVLGACFISVVSVDSPDESQRQ